MGIPGMVHNSRGWLSNCTRTDPGHAFPMETIICQLVESDSAHLFLGRMQMNNFVATIRILGVFSIVLMNHAAVAVENPSRITMEYGNMMAATCSPAPFLGNYTLVKGQTKKISVSYNSFTYNGTGIDVTCLSDCSSTEHNVVETVPYVPIPTGDQGSMVYSSKFTNFHNCYTEWVRVSP